MLLLSICTSCRSNLDNTYDDRAGTRLANKVFEKLVPKEPFYMRGIKCMSNCKRSCVISLASANRFTYMFGDINPDKPEYVKSLIELVSIYGSKQDGFLHRGERPDLFRSNIVGRFPPINSLSKLVTNFN